jgi:surface carbohydrate biosynthesis protein
MIGIVVDHPSRDLPSLCILASEFIKKNIKIALIPSYKIEHALLENPSLFEVIIFNFFRAENYKTILYAKSKNIKVAILDQESVAGTDGLGMANIFKNKILKKYLSCIDYYFFPSKLIMKECLKYNKNKPLNCIVTGYQRLDIVKRRITTVKEKNFVIICTNFPLVNPAFSTKKDIIDSEIKYRSENMMADKLKKNISEIELTFKNFTTEISKIINNFKKVTFVIRPHPFENAKYWKTFEKYKNCIVTNQFNSLEWIIKCSALIHIDCTTSVEASLLNKPSISPWYANKKNEDDGVFKLANECTYLCKSYTIFKKKLELAIKKKLTSKTSKNIDKFFYSPKKLSSTIIVNNILLKSCGSKKVGIIRLNLISYIKFFLEKFGGKKIHDIFLSIYRGSFVSKQRREKSFSLKQIRMYFLPSTKIIKKKFFFILSKN